MGQFIDLEKTAPKMHNEDTYDIWISVEKKGKALSGQKIFGSVIVVY